MIFVDVGWERLLIGLVHFDHNLISPVNHLRGRNQLLTFSLCVVLLFLHASPTDSNTTGTTVCPQSKSQEVT